LCHLVALFLVIKEVYGHFVLGQISFEELLILTEPFPGPYALVFNDRGGCKRLLH